MKKKPETSEVKAKRIGIPKIERASILVNIKGTTPLLVSRFSERAIKEIEASQGGAGKLKKAPRVPAQEFQDARYHMGGKDYFPSIGIKKAMVLAGQRFADEKGTELYGAFSIPTQFIEIINSKPNGKNWPAMRTDIARLQGKTANPVYRPEYWQWEMNVPLDININFLSLDQALNLLNLAGFSVGIGAWRVEKKGIFGQWEIVEVLQQNQASLSKAKHSAV